MFIEQTDDNRIQDKGKVIEVSDHAVQVYRKSSERASLVKILGKEYTCQGGAKMAEEQDGENTFSPTNSSKEHLNAE